MYSHLESGGSAVTAAHCKAQEDLAIVDRILEPQTIANFLSFALGNPLPDGTQPDASVIRLSVDEYSILEANFPPGSSGQSIVNRVASRIGSEEDNTRLCLVGKNIHSLKSRLWEGIIPLSDQRWKEKRLDDPSNFEYAIHHLTAVVAVFEYLNTPIVRGYLRDTFNYIYDHWASADTVLNARRLANGQFQRVSIAKLWTMYMSVHFEVMAQRAHGWVSRHVEALRAPQLQGLRDHQNMTSVGGPDRLQWRFTDHLHVLLETAVKADYLVMIPMDGYKGYAELYPERAAKSGDLHAGDVQRRGPAYAAKMKARSHQIMFDSMMPWNDDGNGRGQTSGEGFAQSAMQQVQAQEEVREEMRGAPGPLPREPWISSALSGVDNSEGEKKTEFGLKIYRLTYGQSEAEWSDFVQKFEAHASDWGDGQTGCHVLKPYLRLVWVDGKEHGIAEGDIEAAKRHFNKENEDSSENEGLRIQENVFLAVDSASFDSYTTNSYRAATTLVLAGDFKGFVLAIDPDFDPEEGIERPDESPGYTGQMRILGSLIWGDLFGIIRSQSALLEDLWPLAIDHPNQVYVGPTTPLQVYTWRKQNAARWIGLREVIEYAKRKMGMSTSSTSGSAGADTPVSTTASTETPQPGSEPEQARGATPNSGPELDPIHQGLRQAMLQDFQMYLRQHGADLEARVVGEMLNHPPGQEIDYAQMGQRFRNNMETRRRQRQQQQEGEGDRNGEDQDAENGTDDVPPPGCPTQ
ncbi:hypothetical protein N7454_008991 [Penicillium verhagenii]|nr:hypothetical protein N7454_008991 [Penicillium verhagenii]